MNNASQSRSIEPNDHTSIVQSDMSQNLKINYSIQFEKKQKLPKLEALDKQLISTQKEKEKQSTDDQLLSKVIQQAANHNLNHLQPQIAQVKKGKDQSLYRQERQQSKMVHINAEHNSPENEHSEIEQRSLIEKSSFLQSYQSKFIQLIESLQDQSFLEDLLNNFQKILQLGQPLHQIKKSQEAPQDVQNNQQMADQQEFAKIHSKYRKYKQLYRNELENSKKLRQQLRKIYDKVSKLE